MPYLSSIQQNVCVPGTIEYFQPFQYSFVITVTAINHAQGQNCWVYIVINIQTIYQELCSMFIFNLSKCIKLYWSNPYLKGVL